MQTLKTRVLRYISTWAWLILLNFKLFPSLLIKAIVFGIIARLGTIVSFIISIKSAIWIFQPQTIPQVFYEYLPINQNMMFGILVLVPGLVFLATGFCRYLSSNNSLKLQIIISDNLATKISLKKLEKTPDEEFLNRKNLSQAAYHLKINHAKLFLVQGMITNLLVLVPVIVISLLIGLIINWIIVMSILGFGIVLIIIFVWRRHQERYVLEKINTDLQTEKSSSVKDLISIHNDTEKDTTRFASKVKAVTDSTSNLKHANEKFRFNSDLSIDIGQSMIVIFFLYILLNTDIQSMQPEYLVVLALLFRFIIGYGKAIVQVILKLSTLYKFVTDIRINLDTDL